MCGRYVSARPAPELASRFAALDRSGGRLEADYNVAPTKAVPAVLERAGRRELLVARWGLVPSWARDASIGSRLINARVETAATKPAFRSALARRRCLLPADGYYEWYQDGPGPRTPVFLHDADGGLLALAGLYESWRDPQGQPLRTVTVLTTSADVAGRVHERAPLLVPPDVWPRWLDPAHPPPLDDLQAAVPGRLAVRVVSREVNDVRHNGAQLLEPVR